MSELNLLEEIGKVIDQHRRDICQMIPKAQGEASHMYYEGQRVGLDRAQKLIESFARIPR